MSSPNPVQPQAKAGNYLDEIAVSQDINAFMRFFAGKKFRVSLSSPPLLKDVPEGEQILDKTLKRVYVTIDGALYYISLTAA